MSQPRPQDPTRERILEAALPVFAQLGFDGASTRKLAEAAGVNVATLAYWFGDKRGLYLAVLTRLNEAMSASFPTTLPMGTGSDFVEAVVRQAWRFVREHRAPIRLQLRHVLDQGRHAEEVFGQWSAPLMARADQLIVAFRPEWPEADRRVLVLTLLHALVRFGLEDPAQLAAMLGGADPDEAVPAYLSRMLRRELGVGGA